MPNLTQEQFIKLRVFEKPPIECNFKVGDIVTYTNDYDVSFHGLKVLGFDDEISYGRFVFLDTDSFWFPVDPEQLKLEKR